MKRAQLTWGIAGLDIVVILATRLIDPAGDISGVVIFTIGVASFAAVGALLDTRVPGNRIGLLLLAAGTLMSAAMATGTYASLGALQEPPWPSSGAALIAGSTLFVYPFMIALIGVPLVFPDGHLPSGRFRWVVRLTIANVVAWTLGAFLRLPPSDGSQAGASDQAGPDPLLGAIQTFFFVTTIVCFGAGAIAVWLRFHRGDRVQRQQIKWLAAIVGLGAVVLPVSFIPDSSSDLSPVINTVTILTLFALPVVIGIAILRYRLYEIDRIVSRTIGWAVVTGVLGAVFVVGLVGLQAALSGVTQGGTLAVAASTLVAFVLFQPVRRRVQAIVDRRFDRSRYDAERTVGGFAERLRNEVDLGTLRTALIRTADDAVRPVNAAVWLRVGSETER
ncbi:MAG TPA: hypothetical protein VHM48_12625 [Candidatus Limnocylindrales bacterium]|nr:hypothetical protein [Candidatus Limnocylindrales bacterium]